MREPNQAYDLIGDIHGYANPLRRLLEKMEYRETNGVYSHPERKVIFLGDYIDRGPNVQETLTIVKSMVDSGAALALMGNHEFNALAYHTEDGQGGHLRPHTKQNIHQHQATLDQLAHAHTTEWQEWLKWFAKLPLFLEIDGLRAVHAAWHPGAVNVARNLGPLTSSVLSRMTDKGSSLAQVKMMLLNGPEVSLPAGYFATDKENNQRTEFRIRWWMDLREKTYRAAAFTYSESIPELPLNPDDLKDGFVPYASNDAPVFFGHYWMCPSESPALLQSNLACLDYSVAKDGFLTAYRWNGEQTLNAGNFVTATSANKNGKLRDVGLMTTIGGKNESRNR